MIKSQSLDSLESLADQYDCFIFDIYGVIYDGASLLTRTIDFIQHLRSKNKAIAFLSNSQRLSPMVEQELNSHGFELKNYEKIFTSGGYFRHFLGSNPALASQHVFYHLGQSPNVEAANIAFTTDLTKATHIIITCSILDEKEINSHDEILKRAAENNCQAICINPDITAPYGNKMLYTPGYFSRKYEEFGGNVMYFGKPHKGIYDLFIGKFLNNLGINKERTIAIGDSLSTDIKGATDFGIDSLLVFSPARKHQSSFNNQNHCVPTYSFQI